MTFAVEKDGLRPKTCKLQPSSVAASGFLTCWSSALWG